LHPANHLEDGSLVNRGGGHKHFLFAAIFPASLALTQAPSGPTMIQVLVETGFLAIRNFLFGEARR
jgi:hypothetical protein